MGRTIMFIHGAWMTPLCWESFAGYFAGQGYCCLTPAWPHHDLPVAALRRSPPAELAGLGIADIVDHHARLVAALDEPPILIGHSFGGLFVQILLDRGLGAAGVALDPAPPQGVPAFYPSVVRANAGVLSTPFGWRRVVRMSLPQFQYAFVNGMPLAEQRAIYERHVVPETGRIFFQAAIEPLDARSPARVRFMNGKRAPLLLVAGDNDNIIPARMVVATYRKYRGSAARTDLRRFAGRTHWIIAQPEWQEVAEAAHAWIRELPGGVGG